MPAPSVAHAVAQILTTHDCAFGYVAREARSRHVFLRAAPLAASVTAAASSRMLSSFLANAACGPEHARKLMAAIRSRALRYPSHSGSPRGWSEAGGAPVRQRFRRSASIALKGAADPLPDPNRAPASRQCLAVHAALGRLRRHGFNSCPQFELRRLVSRTASGVQVGVPRRR